MLRTPTIGTFFAPICQSFPLEDVSRQFFSNYQCIKPSSFFALILHGQNNEFTND